MAPIRQIYSNRQFGQGRIIILTETGQIFHVEDVKDKKKHMKFKGPSFEIKKYAFFDTPKDSTS